MLIYMFVLFFISVLVVTPVSLYFVVDESLKTVVQGNSLFQNLIGSVRNLLTPLSLALCNSVIIPLIVDVVAALLPRETKSDE